METPTFSTADTILTAARGESGVGSNPKSVALQNTAMLRQLHDINSEFVNYPYTIGVQGWPFLKAEAIIKAVQNTSLNGAVSSGAVTITLTDASNFEDPASTAIAAGYIKTGNSIFDYFMYTDKTSNTCSGVSGLQIDHADAEAVHKIYALPSNFGKMRNVFARSPNAEYYYMDDDFRQTPPRQHYMLKYLSNGTYSNTFIIFPESIGSYEFKAHYVKKAATIDEISDYVDAPDGEGRRFLIEKLKAYVWSHLGEENDAQIAMNKATLSIRDCAARWSKPHVQVSNSLPILW